MPDSIYIDIEVNDNCEYMPPLVYEARGDPVPVQRVRLYEPDRPHGVYEVTGWSCSSGPSAARYVPVSDSGQAEAHLVFGDDWGVRLKPEGADEEWDLDSPNQWGEPYLILVDRADVLLDGEGEGEVNSNE